MSYRLRWRAMPVSCSKAVVLVGAGEAG